MRLINNVISQIRKEHNIPYQEPISETIDDRTIYMPRAAGDNIAPMRKTELSIGETKQELKNLGFPKDAIENGAWDESIGHIKDFIKQEYLAYKTSKQTKSIIFTGRFGAGKTTVMILCAYEILRRYKINIAYTRLQDQIEASLQKESPLREMANTSQLLFFDDFSFDKANEYFVGIKTDIIKSRYDKGLGTFISTNTNIDDMNSENKNINNLYLQLDDLFSNSNKYSKCNFKNISRRKQ